METQDRQDSSAQSSTSDALSLRSLLFSLPPAVTLLGNFSLLFFVGPIAEWLNEHWFRLTRHFWDVLFRPLEFLNLTVGAKDYLTSIVFFAPILCLSIFIARPIPEYQMTPRKHKVLFAIAGATGLAILYILVRQAFEDLEAMTDSLFMFFYFFFATGFAILALVILEKHISEPRSAYLGPNGRPLSRARRTAFVTACGLMVVACLASVIYDIGVAYVNDFRVVDNEEFLRGLMISSFPYRSGASAIVGLIIVIAIGVKISPVTPMPKPRKTNPALWITPFRLIIALVILFAILALNVGPVETALLLTLLIMLFVIAIRAPLRLISIGLTFVILLSSSYVIWAANEAKAVLEAVG